MKIFAKINPFNKSYDDITDITLSMLLVSVGLIIIAWAFQALGFGNAAIISAVIVYIWAFIVIFYTLVAVVMFIIELKKPHS
jgi:hypothetical protein